MAKKEIYGNKPKTKVTESVKTHQYDTFIIVEKNGKCFIAFTDKIISKEQFESVEDAQKYINSKPWELLINVPCAVMDILSKKTTSK